VWDRSASFETDLNAGTDGWNFSTNFAVTRSTEVGGADGLAAAKIVYNGGNSSSGCSCPRMKFENASTVFNVGREVWMRGAWRFPSPSTHSWSRMMNLISYTNGGATDYYTGLVIESSGQMLVRSRFYHSTTGQKLIIPARPIPAGQWFTVKLHLRLSNVDGQALTEMYVDDVLVASSTVANMMGTQRINAMQGGMPYFLNTTAKGSTVFFDHPGLAY
jgi:hypothetical protein